MALAFLDTNVFLRHLTQDHPVHSPKATAYLERIERGELRVRITDTVVFETVFTLQSFYKQPRDRIRDNLLPLIELTGIVLPGKRKFRRVFELYGRLNISFADAYHAVTMQQLRLTEIATFDRNFDRVPGINRLEL
jgi:predicted nucleic acid-binding protein